MSACHPSLVEDRFFCVLLVARCSSFIHGLSNPAKLSVKIVDRCISRLTGMCAAALCVFLRGPWTYSRQQHSHDVLQCHIARSGQLTTLLTSWNNSPCHRCLTSDVLRCRCFFRVSVGIIDCPILNIPHSAREACYVMFTVSRKDCSDD